MTSEYKTKQKDCLLNVLKEHKDSILSCDDIYMLLVKENKKIFKASFNNPSGMKAKNKYNHLKDYILNPILDRFNIAEKEKNYLLTFYINGIMAIIKEWIDIDCKDSINDIENIIIKCVGTH